MAVTTGFSEPYVAKYSNTGTTVSYSGGMKLGRGVSMSIEVESADDNNFYADDIVAKTETGTMTSASATVTVDGEKVKTWMKNGAQPTDTVRGLLKKAGVL